MAVFWELARRAEEEEKKVEGRRRRPGLRADCPTGPCRRGRRACRPSIFHKGGEGKKGGDGGEKEGRGGDTVWPSG